MNCFSSFPIIENESNFPVYYSGRERRNGLTNFWKLHVPAINNFNAEKLKYNSIHNLPNRFSAFQVSSKQYILVDEILRLFVVKDRTIYSTLYIHLHDSICWLLALCTLIQV